MLAGRGGGMRVLRSWGKFAAGRVPMLGAPPGRARRHAVGGAIASRGPQPTEEPADIEPSAVSPAEHALPGVSYVMPVLNEADYVEDAVRSILDQEYPGPTEIVLALGPSTDGTDDVVAGMTEQDPRIRTVPNPRTAIPSGLNQAIAASSHPVIVRVDAHTELPAGYTRRAVETLLRVEADNVGGIMTAVGRPGLQQAIAHAYNSRLGLGGGAYHSADVAEGPAESAYLGVMRASALADIGGFDETLQRGEDWEMNQRMLAAGHRVWLDPALHVTYWPRSSWRALSKQFHATGIWRGELARRSRGRHPLRYYAPPLLVAVAGASVVLVPVGARGRRPAGPARRGGRCGRPRLRRGPRGRGRRAAGVAARPGAVRRGARHDAPQLGPRHAARSCPGRSGAPRRPLPARLRPHVSRASPRRTCARRRAPPRARRRSARTSPATPPGARRASRAGLDVPDRVEQVVARLHHRTGRIGHQVEVEPAQLTTVVRRCRA